MGVTAECDGGDSGPEADPPMLRAQSVGGVKMDEAADEDWAALATSWTSVRQRAGRLRALADTLDIAADEWDAIIRLRPTRLA